MKKIQPIYAVLFTLFLLYAFSSNPPNANTGAPGEENCTRCHTGSNNSFGGTVSVQGLPTVIEPGNTYRLSVATKVTAGSPSRAGFQMVILDEANDNVGSLSNADNNSTVTAANGRSYFEHDPAISFNGADSVAWEVDWTAPASLNTDSIKIYINSILGNGSGSGNDLMVSNQSTFGFQTATVEPIVASISSNDVTCFGDSNGAATVTATGGTGNYVFNWSNGGNSANITNLAAGDYTVTVSDEENNADTVSVTILEPTAINIALGDLPKVNCTTDTISVMPTVTGGTGNYTYDWSNALTTSAANLPAGSYDLTVSDANQCTATVAFTVEADTILPTVVLGADIIITCADTNTSFIQIPTNGLSTAPELAYNWTTAGGNIVSGASTLNPIVDASGNYVLTATNTTNGCTATDTINLLFDTTLPIANAGPDQQISCTRTSLVLKGDGSSTGESIRYEWFEIGSDFVTLDSIEVYNMGTYVLTVRNNATGCSATDTVLVTEDTDLPSILPFTDIVLGCNADDTLRVTGTATVGENIIYEWSTVDGAILESDTTLTVAFSQVGTYTLTVTDTSSNCSANASFNVSAAQPPTAFIESTENLGCNNASVVLDGRNSIGDNLGYTWLTSNGDFVTMDSFPPTISVTMPDTYTLIVTDTQTGCSDTATVTIELVENSDLFAASGDADQLTCTRDSITLNGNATQEPNIIYEWTTEDGNILSGGQTLTPTINAPGRYTLTARDTVTGCTASSYVTIAQDINLPTVNAVASDILDCNTSVVTLTGSSDTEFNLIYNWTTDNGTIDSGANTPNPVVSTSGTYTLTVIDTFTNCANSASVQVMADVELPVVGAVVDGQLDCTNDTISLRGNSAVGPGIVHVWTTSDGNILTDSSLLLINVNAAGTYVLTVTDTLKGCSNSETVIIIADTTKPLAEAGPANQSFCDNSTLSINATVDMGDNFTYFWCTEDGSVLEGAETPNVVINGGGLFEFIVTNTDNGCKSIDTVQITTLVSPVISLDTLNDSTINLVVSPNDSTLNFTFSGDMLPDNLSDLAAGDYSVTVTDTNGCADELNFTVETSTSLAEIETSLAQWQVYPNPVRHVLAVDVAFTTLQTGRIAIVNHIGQPVWQQTFSQQRINEQINVQHWSAGVYFLLIQTKQGIKSEEILVIK